MSETISQVPTTQEQEREAQLAAKYAAQWAEVSEFSRTLAKQLYPAIPDECEGINHDEFYVGVVEQIQAFQHETTRHPRTGAELDAWSNSAEEFAEYVKANPLPAAPASAPVPEVKKDAPASVNPAASKEDVEKAMDKFAHAVGLQADLNYQIAERGADYVRVFLAAAPGIALRSKATEQLAAVLFRASDDVFILSESEGVKKHRARVWSMLAVNAVRVLIGDGSGNEKGEGAKRGRKGKGKEARLPWGKVREFTPLVSRKEDDHSEEWSLHQSAGKEGVKAKGLLGKVCDAPDLTASEIREAVRTLRRQYALDCGDKEEAKRWGHKEEPAPAPTTPPATPPASTPPASQDNPMLTVAPATEEKKEEPAPATPPVAPASNPAPCHQGPSILVTLADMAKNGTPKDVGVTLAATIKAGDDVLALLHDTIEALASAFDRDGECPYGADDIFETTMKALRNHPGLSSRGKRAMQGAELLLSRKEAPAATADNGAAK